MNEQELPSFRQRIESIILSLIIFIGSLCFWQSPGKPDDESRT